MSVNHISPATTRTLLFPNPVLRIAFAVKQPTSVLQQVPILRPVKMMGPVRFVMTILLVCTTLAPSVLEQVAVLKIKLKIFVIMITPKQLLTPVLVVPVSRAVLITMGKMRVKQIVV